MKSRELVEVTLDGEINRYQVAFELVTITETDTNFGADADGRRGIPLTFIVDSYPDDIRVLLGDRWMPVVEVNETTAGEIMKLIDAWIEERLNNGS